MSLDTSRQDDSRPSEDESIRNANEYDAPMNTIDRESPRSPNRSVVNPEASVPLVL